MKVSWGILISGSFQFEIVNRHHFWLTIEVIVKNMPFGTLRFRPPVQCMFSPVNCLTLVDFKELIIQDKAKAFNFKINFMCTFSAYDDVAPSSLSSTRFCLSLSPFSTRPFTLSLCCFVLCRLPTLDMYSNTCLWAQMFLRVCRRMVPGTLKRIPRIMSRGCRYCQRFDSVL